MIVFLLPIIRYFATHFVNVTWLAIHFSVDTKDSA